ncbi:MAG: hypothetical protein ACKO39_13750 [Chthoniobacterales bacterium]
MRSLIHFGMAAFLAMLLSGCANKAEELLGRDPGTGLYQRSLNPEADDRAAIRFHAAYQKRDPAALREEFADARALCEADEFNASESVAMAWLLPLYVVRFGDKNFAAVLASEPPRTQSAVSYHMSVANRNSSDPADFARLYPETDRILRAAPEVDWPVDKAIATIMAN